MRKLLLFSFLFGCTFLMAFHPFDLGLHMGQSTGGAGGSFPGDKILIEGTSDCVLIEGTSDCVLME